MEIPVDGAPDQDFLWFRDLRGQRQSIHANQRELASLTGAVEAIRDRNKRRALGLYLGVWSGAPFDIPELSDRFGLSVFNMRRLLAEARREAMAVGDVPGRIAESVWALDDADLESYTEDEDCAEDDYGEESNP